MVEPLNCEWLEEVQGGWGQGERLYLGETVGWDWEAQRYRGSDGSELDKGGFGQFC